MVKFSVDGAATSDKAGCRGVLQDAHRIISLMFLGHLSPVGPEFAELVAIMKALELFKAAKWIGRASLIVESDSKLNNSASRLEVFVLVLVKHTTF
ncbi:hypothetical protein V6N13_029152 [Hibiscus sabdariffa]